MKSLSLKWLIALLEGVGDNVQAAWPHVLALVALIEKQIGEIPAFAEPEEGDDEDYDAVFEKLDGEVDAGEMNHVVAVLKASEATAA